MHPGNFAKEEPAEILERICILYDGLLSVLSDLVRYRVVLLICFGNAVVWINHRDHIPDALIK